MGQRFWEIDLARGTAVVMMVIFHVVFDLAYFAVYPFEVGIGFWKYFAIMTASVFIFISGMSLTISHSRSGTKKQMLRAVRIFGFGMLATLATLLFVGNGFVVFGILHFIGLSIIVSIPLMKLGKGNILVAIIIIAAGYFIQSLYFDFPWLLWLGLKPAGFYSVDYFPLLPWLGVFVLGIFFGKTFYSDGKRKFSLRENNNIIAKPLCFLGRWSLAIYLIHQVIIVGILYIIL